MSTVNNNNNEENRQVICRDYLRNVCARGETCKYKHPPGRYVFCHDYQNGRCKRDECMFIHCSREDEEHYNQTGELPPHLNDLPQVSGITVCKDFMRGECHRSVCKYQHPQRPVNVLRHSPPPPPPQEFIQTKRIRYESEVLVNAPWNLEAENTMLRHTVDELRRKVEELQATNEFLLEQNAQLRNKVREVGQVGLTAVTVPAVTLTNAAQIPPPNAAAIRAVTATVPVSLAAVAATPVSIATVSMAPVQMPASSVAISQNSTTGQPMVSYPLVPRPMINNTLPHQ